MGTTYLFICSGCNYEAEVDGGLSGGISARSNLLSAAAGWEAGPWMQKGPPPEPEGSRDGPGYYGVKGVADGLSASRKEASTVAASNTTTLKK